MGGVYDIIRTVHNAVGGITLLLTIASAIVLLATARTTSQVSSTVVRANHISAALQGLLGVILIVLGLVIGIATASLWLHYILGIAAVGVISVFAARAHRAPDAEARRFGLIFLGIVVLVLVTFLIGQFNYNPLG